MMDIDEKERCDVGHPFETFGKYQFNRSVMRDRLPKPVYEKYRGAMKHQQFIDQSTADAIAHAMKTWAMELGATHFCHWFQPLNGRTAEKHESFIQPDHNGMPLSRLSGKALMKGETDGSSFPNGGLRDTFEARGYTFWDTNSYAFVRGTTLYIPSVFMSYRGDTLDLKMPLIKALDALSAQAVRVLHDLGKTDVNWVEPTLGLEQEFFLVDAQQAAKRPDIKLCGRTLYGSEMLQGGHLQDTYFQGMNERVQQYMNEVNRACWNLGIYASIEHNEVSPGQYEFSSVFGDAITTVDQNMVVMDILENVAPHHGFQCLLHEKPFGGLNGSGKHSNLSLTTSTGENLFDPGDEQPHDLRFLLFVTAFIVAVDRYQTLLRMAASDEGNDHRLGGHEAPPAIISINLGETLHSLFVELAKTTKIPKVKLTSILEPVVTLADLSIETTDRNRTSPVSFTGNRFELRMLGSSLNASAMNTFLFAGMAESLEEIALQLEASDTSTPEALHDTTMQICHHALQQHQRILFTGDGYRQEWVEESKRRGLEQVPSYLESIDAATQEETVRLCERFGVLSREELVARREILIERFNHSVDLQGQVLARMATKGIYPALMEYQIRLQKADAGGLSTSLEKKAKENARLIDALDAASTALKESLEKAEGMDDAHRQSVCYRDEVREAMHALEEVCNEIEAFVPEELLPYPSSSVLVVQ